MKTKSFFLAIATIVILLSGCSKDTDVKSDNELMNLYEKFESYDGKTIQSAKADLNSNSFSTVSQESGSFEFKKTENGTTYNVVLYSNSDLDDLVYYITVEIKASNSQASITQFATFNGFIKSFGKSRKLPSGDKVAFYYFENARTEGDDWSEMIDELELTSSHFDVTWESNEGSSVNAHTENKSVSFSIYDATYAPEY